MESKIIVSLAVFCCRTFHFTFLKCMGHSFKKHLFELIRGAIVLFIFTSLMVLSTFSFILQVFKMYLLIWFELTFSSSMWKQNGPHVFSCFACPDTEIEPVHSNLFCTFQNLWLSRSNIGLIQLWSICLACTKINTF